MKKLEKPIYLEVKGETTKDINIKINGKTPDKILYISYFIEPKQRFGELYIECKSGATYKVIDFGEIKIKHGKWEITSDYNTPRTTEIKYKNKEINGIRTVSYTHLTLPTKAYV